MLCKLKNVVLICSLWVCAVFQVSAAPKPTFLFLGEQSPPLIFVDKDNTLNGLLIDIAEEMIRLADIDARISVVPWARAYEMAFNEPNIVLMALLKTPVREHKFQWIGKVHEAKASLFALNDTALSEMTTLAQARAYRIASVRGYGSTHYLLNNGFSATHNLMLARSPEMLWDLLFNKRVDLVLSNLVTTPFEVQSAGYQTKDLKHVINVPELTLDLFFATGLRTADEHTARLQEALTALHDSGKVAELTKFWMAKDYNFD